MEATRVILVRHGETAWNADTRIQGQLDVPLNERGEWQARRAAEALAEEPLAAIYASDLSRAFRTAQLIAQPHGIVVQPEPGLRERAFGHFEGLTFAEIHRDHPEDAQRWRGRDPDFSPGGGECLHDFRDRVLPLAHALAERHAGELIALVAHGGVLDLLHRAATRQELQAPRTWRIGNASINRLLWTPGGFTLVGWSDETHLNQLSMDELGDNG